MGLWLCLLVLGVVHQAAEGLRMFSEEGVGELAMRQQISRLSRCQAKLGAAERQVNFTEFSGMLIAAPGTPAESRLSRCQTKMGAAERQVNFTEFSGMLTAAQGTPGELRRCG